MGGTRARDVIRDREAAREAVRHAENLAIGAQLLKDPTSLLDRLTATNATYRLRDIEKLVKEKILDVDQQIELIKRVVEASVELKDDRGKTRFTTQAVIDTEKAAYRAATDLSNSKNTKISRPASSHLDEQQIQAYEYATNNQGRLKVITGRSRCRQDDVNI